ncbi:hypothetical protein POVCU2_0025800 [Plasmodium ovale curtisi]|uniref:Uncharacterized protein n=1 Tax=Plasmodium ovale curtisi TaxID=864141 RepID=A0A1A8VV64_PLAOA|nr:hypothetical protein POVCU2_0025800 [Plasmodium ovale curtisi]SBS92577.1 hypothetical protein POVCU1_023540 [Plasmodium ovale curtisi]
MDLSKNVLNCSQQRSANLPICFSCGHLCKATKDVHPVLIGCWFILIFNTRIWKFEDSGEMNHLTGRNGAERGTDGQHSKRRRREGGKTMDHSERIASHRTPEALINFE